MSLSVSPLRTARDLSALLDILAPTFNFARPLGQRYTKIVGRKNYRVVRSGSTVLGGCALLPFGQFFGGKSVPMMGVGAVGIAPEHRGQRAASTLMQACLKEMRKRGYPLSALYPATLPLYRSVGYEQAGVRFEVRIPAKTLNLRGTDRAAHLQVRRITAKDQPLLERCYRAKASINNGNLDRSDFIWHRVFEPRGQKTLGVAVINPKTKAAEGYTLYLQKETPEAPYSLHLTDLVALTPDAGRRLLWFFADHRSMTHEVVFTGTPDDPIIKLLPERNYHAKLLDHWMLRIVDVAKALTMRGYSPNVAGEAHLDIEDDLVSDNAGKYLVSVNNGRAKVKRGGTGAIRLDIRGLAALYSSHVTPANLLVTGQMDASAKAGDQVDALQAMFAGPAPWLPDMF